MSQSLLNAFAARPLVHQPPPDSIRRHSIDDTNTSLSGLDDAIIDAVTAKPGELASPQLYDICGEFADDRPHFARALARLVRLGHIATFDTLDVPPGQRRYRPGHCIPTEPAQHHAASVMDHHAHARVQQTRPAAARAESDIRPNAAAACAATAVTRSSLPQSKQSHAMAASPKVLSHEELRSAAERIAVAATHVPDAGQTDSDDDDETGEHPASAENVRERLDSSNFDEPVGPTLGVTRAGHLAIDLPVLMRTRLLVTAASGGGKSWAVRRVLEETAPLVQQIVIDPEGEFDTLTENFPYVVFNDRDTKVPLSKCSPYALAQELVKTRISAVIDISDFETDHRDHFVARFIKGLMKIQKEHWHHVMVVLDESHIFAPQQDRSEAKKSIIDLACRGRKRGYCAVLATNRLSLLSKSVASEMQNRLIGQTGLDTDLKRAADELGMGRLHTVATLTALDPGNFMAYGPALTKTVQRVAVGPVRTTHGVQLGRVQRPATASTELLDAIFATVEEKSDEKHKKLEEDEGEEGATESDTKAARKETDRAVARAQIAAQRLELLKPVLAAGEGQRAKAIRAAAAASGLNPATFYLWLKKYDPQDPEGSMTPSRIPSDFVFKDTAPAKAPVADIESATPPPTARKKVLRLTSIAPMATRTFSRFQRLKLRTAGLTDRHIQVLEASLDGRPADVVAAELGISLSHLEGHLQLCLMLLGVKDLDQLANELTSGRFSDRYAAKTSAPGNDPILADAIESLCTPVSVEPAAPPATSGISELKASLPACCKANDLACPSATDLAAAADKFDAMMPGSQAIVSERAVRKYKTQFQEAHERYGNGLIGLLPRIARSNRASRLAPEVDAVLVSTLKAAARYGWNRSAAYEKFLGRCAKARVGAATQKTFYTRFERHAQQG